MGLVMVKLTITVDKQVLTKAKERAAQEGTTVQAVLQDHLEFYAGSQNQYQQATAKILEIARQSTASSQNKRWTRKELNQR
ncbi:MAG: hypothetical protein R3F02_10495 [Thiolinea sp.]